MNPKHPRPALDQAEDGLPSPFDLAEAEGDLWFLPDDDLEPDQGQFAPLPRAPQALLFDPDEWQQAQGDLAPELAALTLRFGMLDERLGHMGSGVPQRLAIREASEMSWWAGTRVGVDRLALWVGARTGGGMDDSLALAQAGWTVRRLTAGARPAAQGWEAGTAAFLGYAEGLPSHPVEELAEVMGAVRHLHPVTQAAILFHAWRITGQGPSRDMEAATMAACHGASMGQGRAPFLPLTMSGVEALRASGSVASRLARWISGAEQATLSALMQLDRLRTWQDTSRKALEDLSGRTPGLLADLFAAWPMISAPMAEEKTGASRAAVQRNLDLMVQRGLIREVTGQGRFRVWAAKFS